MDCPHQINDYKSDIKPIWCRGCGNYGVLSAIYHALAELDIDRRKLVEVSGIGCAARMPYFIESYKMHTLHGRAGPVATGVQLANPELKVMVTGGDGDGFAIGGGHMSHLARRNVDITYILIDNHIYGMTTGQASPTSDEGKITYTTPYGSIDKPVRPLLYMLAYEASYVAQGFAGDPKICAQLIKAGLEHRGFAYIHIISQCPTFNPDQGVKDLKQGIRPVPESHNVSDLQSAMQLVLSFADTEPVGLIYQQERPTLDAHMAALVEKAGGSKEYDVRRIIDQLRP